MTLKEFINLIYSLGGNMDTELWIVDNNGYYDNLTEEKVTIDVDGSIDIHAEFY